MKVLNRSRRLRSSVSALMATVMLLTITPFAAIAATPASPTLTDPGTTGLATVTGQASNGLNGVHSLEVTGTVATKSVFKGAILGPNTILNDVQSFIAEPALVPAMTVNYVDSFGALHSRTITGLTRASTISSVISAINSQVEMVTAGFDTAGRVAITADQYGVTEISGSGSAWEALFELNGAVNDYSPMGVAYGDNFRVINNFTPVDGRQYLVETITPASGRMGHVGADGSFVTGRHPASGAYTAIKLAPGYDVVLATANAQMGLTPGVARVTLTTGVRDVAEPSVHSVTPNMVEAGTHQTLTVRLDAPVSAEATAVVDRVRLTLPAGFSFTSTATVSVPAGSMAASASVDATAGVVNVWNFRLGGSAAPDAGTPLRLDLEGVVSATAAAEKYAFGVQYRNIGSSELKTLDYDAQALNSVEVLPLNEVASIDLSATGNRAGGTSVLGAHLYDKYGNLIEAPYWPRTVNFSIAGPPAGLASTLQHPSVGIAPTDGYYGYRNEARLSATEGTTTVTASVLTYSVPGATKTTTATVTIDTRGVGAPSKLVLTSDMNPATVDTHVRFRIGLVDANGKATSFLDGPASRDYTIFYGQGGASSDVEPIATKFSESVFHMTSATAGTWDMWAVDTVRGAVFESAVLEQVWGALPAPPGVYSALKVTASPVVQDRYVDGYPLLVNEGNFGYSQADGVSPVTFTVTTVDSRGVPVATPGITIKAEDLDDPRGGARPGVITPVSAVTNAAGVATFQVTSTVPSKRSGDGDVFPFNEWQFSDAAAPARRASGYANHFTALVHDVTVDRSVARADGIDAITVTAHMADPFEHEPVAGARAFFSQSAGGAPAVLSATQAVSDATGGASITVKSAAPGEAHIMAKDVVGGSSDWVMARFTNFVARPVQSMITAQQSDRGPLADVDWVIEDLQGNPVSFDEVKWAYFSGESVWDGHVASDEDSVIRTEILGYYDLEADELVRAIMSGVIAQEGRFGATTEYFVGDVEFLVVDNASAQVNWIDEADGSFRSRFTVTGSDFRRSSNYWRYALNGNNNGYAGGYDRTWIEHQNARGQWVGAGYGLIDSSGYLVPDFDTRLDGSDFTERDMIIPLRLGASLPAGTYDVRVDGIVFPDLLRIGAADATRVFGADRYLTAVELSAANFASADSVVIASGENFPDALTASALAGAIEAPVLLTRAGSVPAAVLAEIDRLGAGKAYIIGGTGAVSPAVVSALQGAGLAVERIAGADRYATAAAVADKVLAVTGTAWNGEVFIASGEDFPDALAAAPVAAANGMPILLTRAGALPAATAAFLNDNDVEKSHVVGGTGVIGAWIQTAAPGATRIAGANRYATAVEVAKFAETMGMNWGYLGIASGENFPDALAGGVVVGRNRGMLLLTQPNVLTPATAAAITANTPVRGEVYGGPGAISATVLEALEGLF